jgi:hypothetical protein
MKKGKRAVGDRINRMDRIKTNSVNPINPVKKSGWLILPLSAAGRGLFSAGSSIKHHPIIL